VADEEEARRAGGHGGDEVAQTEVRVQIAEAEVQIVVRAEDQTEDQGARGYAVRMALPEGGEGTRAVVECHHADEEVDPSPLDQSGDGRKPLGHERCFGAVGVDANVPEDCDRVLRQIIQNI